MKATLTNTITIYQTSLEKVLTEFFHKNTPDSFYSFTFKIFQCWVVNGCKSKANLPDEEVALLLDQLNTLVAAAYILHEGDRVQATLQKGEISD